MNKLSAFVLMLVACRTAAAVIEPTAPNAVDHVHGRAPLQLAIFSSHVEDIAMQESEPFAEAAAKVRAAGIEGAEREGDPLFVFEDRGVEIHGDLREAKR